MTVEERLKELIIKQYGTMKDFTDFIGIPNSTFANILRRGVQNANVLTIIKICQALGISTDDLAQGRIVPIKREAPETKDIESILTAAKDEILNSKDLTLNGKLMTEDAVTNFILSIDMITELEKKRMMNK